MNKFKLKFEETIKARHEIVIETDFDWEEMEEKIDHLRLSDYTFGDLSFMLENDCECGVIDATEVDLETDNMECTDIDEVEE